MIKPNFVVRAFLDGFLGYVSRKQCNRADKKMRKCLSERQIDDMLRDSFPASDPSSTY